MGQGVYEVTDFQSSGFSYRGFDSWTWQCLTFVDPLGRSAGGLGV